MKKGIFLLGFSLLGLLTGCSSEMQEGNNNQQVVKGEDGVGILSINLTSSEGNVDIYTITYTDNSTSTFKVTNGEDGAQGIQGEPGKDGVIPTIEIGENGNWIINGADTGIKAEGEKGEQGDPGLTPFIGDNGNWWIGETDTGVKAKGEDGTDGVDGTNGENGQTPFIGDNGNWWIGETDTGIKAKGEDGTDGKGIKSITLKSSEDNIDTYVILFSDGSETTFTITNGKDGSPGLQGDTGKDGKTAFEIFKEYYPDYEGSEEEWIDDVIKGEFNKVKVTLNPNGGTLNGTKTLEVKYGSSIGDLLPEPTKEGKEFLGWFTGWSTANDAQVNKLTPIYSDITLIAKWDTYDIKFFGNNGEIFYSTEVKHGEKVSEPLNNPTGDENSNFLDWNFDFNESIYHDTNIRSLWEIDGEVLMTFGSYPQTVVSDEATKRELSSLENSDVNNSVLEYDKNNDGIKEKYLVQNTIKRVTADDGSTIEVGKNYFEIEPIEWRVLSQDSSSYSVISQKVLDAKYWNETPYRLIKEDLNLNEIVYNYYETSDIRYWLNDEFLNFAFSEDEQEKIPTTLVDNSLESTLNTSNDYICNDTDDKIYLLSRKEVASAPFSTDEYEQDTKRIGKATDYAKAMGVHGLLTESTKFNNCNWWLRTPDRYDGYYVGGVHNGGNAVQYTFEAFSELLGVRPGLHINI